MKIIESSNYKMLSNIPQYPLAGFWYSIVELNSSYLLSTYYSKFYDNGMSTVKTDRYDWLSELLTPTADYYPSISNLRKARVLSTNDKLKVSIQLPGELQSKSVILILLYAIDLLKYPNADITSSGQSQLRYISDPKNISIVVAGDPNSKEFVNSSTNIIDLINVPKCSLITDISGNELDCHESHYAGDELPLGLYADTRANTKLFIEHLSGDELMRSKLGTERPIELDGCMTIGTDRVIRL